MINYLLLPASIESVELYRLLLLILAGGYGQSEIQPVWISYNNKDDELLFDQINQLTIDYLGARNEIRSILKETRLFSSELYPPIEWLLPLKEESSASFRMDCCEKVIRYLKQMQHFPTKEQLSEGTFRFVYLHHLDETRQIGANFFSALVVMNKESFMPVQTVVRVSQKSVDEKEAMLLPYSARCLSYFQGNGNLLVAGLNQGKEALLAPDFVKLKAAIALAYALCTENGCSAVVANRGFRTGASYTSDIFPSEQASISLNAMGCMLGIYKEAAKGGLSSWNRAFLAPMDDVFWPNWPEFQKIEPFLKRTADLVKNLTYSIDNIEIIPSICKTLTRHKKLDAHANLRERAVAQFLSLYNELKVYYPLESLNKPDLNGCPLPDFTVNKQEILQNTGGFSLRYLRNIAVSPCPFIETSLLAFSPEMHSYDSARSLRSLCLDIWEKIYRQEVLGQNDIYSIKELDLRKELNDIQQALLSVSPEGEKVLSARWMYMLCTDETCVAIAHPAIGFVPLHDVPSDNNIRELGEREHDFIIFMGMYIEMFSEQMSPLFVQYVRTQSQMLRSSIESDGYNIIAKYPTLRHHVGLDVISI